VNVLRKFAASIAARKERIILWGKGLSIVTIGHTLKWLEDLLFDKVLYPSVAAYFLWSFGSLYGPLVTFGVMSTASAILCRLYIYLYDRFQVDWLGFEAVKDFGKESKHKWVRKALMKGDGLAFIILNMAFDPFVTTIYLRKKENRYLGLTWRDEKIFWGSVAFSNAYWTLSVSVILVIGLEVWQQIKDFILSLYHEGAWFWEVILPRLLT
jgi:hypothetical protein